MYRGCGRDQLELLYGQSIRHFNLKCLNLESGPGQDALDMMNRQKLTCKMENSLLGFNLAWDLGNSIFNSITCYL